MLGREVIVCLGLGILAWACSSKSSGTDDSNCATACKNSLELCQVGNQADCENECNEHFSPNQLKCLTQAKTCSDATVCGGAVGWSCFEDPESGYCDCKTPPDPKNIATTCSGSYSCCVSDGSQCNCPSPDDIGTQSCSEYAAGRTIVNTCP